MTQASAAVAGLVPNNGGGLSFAVDDFARLRRFLVLGAEGGSYYVRAPKLAFDNATALLRLLSDGRGLDVVKAIVEISVEGRAAKQGPVLFALALCSRFGDAQVRAAALAALKEVCRTGSTLTQFLKMHAELAGADKPNGDAGKEGAKVAWGRAMRREMGNWYLSKDPMALAYQVTKYTKREGWSHRDLLRLAHPSPAKYAASLKRKSEGAEKELITLPAVSTVEAAPEKAAPDEDADEAGPALKRQKLADPNQLAADLQALFTFITKGQVPAATGVADGPAPSGKLIEYLAAASLVKTCKPQPATPADSWELRVCELIQQHRFTWEHIGDTRLLKSPAIWTALLQSSLPMGALLRNLGRLTAVGVFDQPPNVAKACERFGSEAAIRSARLHPLTILEAMRTYATGSGEKGSLRWRAHPAILAALDKAFYLAFRTLQPAGKRFLVALDVSGSMQWENCAGMRLTPGDAGMALTMALMHSEPAVTTVAFSEELVPLKLTLADTLESAMAQTADFEFGGTDCAAPMVYAAQQGMAVDVFVVITDNETNRNSVPPHVALQQYRASSGIRDAKLVVMAMTATEFSIADPGDAGMLDMAGLDSAAPQLLRDFAMGKL